MTEKKYNYRNEMKWENQKAKEERAIQEWKRNNIGIMVSGVIFLITLLMMLNGIRLNGNLSTLLIVVSMTGLFYFGRELRVLPKGQLIFSTMKAFLCLTMALTYVVLHQGFWDWMDFGILGILIGVVLLDIPRVMKAWKELHS